MTTFLLVRHGAHDWLGRGLAGRLGGVSLNPQGWHQAEELVRRLEGRTIHAIYSSPQPRAVQTVAPLSGRRRLKVHVSDAFDEIDFGEWTGREFDSLRDDERWRHWNFHRGWAQAPGGEVFEQVRQRAVKGLAQLCKRHPQHSVLVSSHADVIKAMLASVLQMPLDALGSFEIEPASLSVVEMGDGWWKVLLLNGA